MGLDLGSAMQFSRWKFEMVWHKFSWHHQTGDNAGCHHHVRQNPCEPFGVRFPSSFSARALMWSTCIDIVQSLANSSWPRHTWNVFFLFAVSLSFISGITSLLITINCKVIPEFLGLYLSGPPCTYLSDPYFVSLLAEVSTLFCDIAM